MKVLVTPRSVTKSGHRSLDALGQAGYEVVFCTPGEMPGEDELISLLPGCVGYLAGVEKITARVLESAKDLEVISRNGTGVDSVDLEAAEKLGIKVCRAEGANARGVAELALALMLALARSLPYHDAAIKADGWERRSGVELEGRTLGLLGCGKIGKIVAGFGVAMGMKVMAYDPYPDQSFAPSPDFSYASMDEVIAASDFISLHCPATGGGPVIDAEAVGKMKKGAYLINTARGSLVDEKALLAGITECRIAGFGTDVFETEPPVNRELHKSDRVIAAPHIGALTSESTSRAMTLAVENLLGALKE